MLRKLLPQRLKAYLKAELPWLEKVRLSELMTGHWGFFPHRPQSQCYLLPKTPEKGEFHPLSSLPVPPGELWVGYGPTVEEYLTSGMRHVQAMREIVDQSGADDVWRPHELEVWAGLLERRLGAGLFGALAELEAVKRSGTWRIGRALTSPMRRLKDLLLP